MRENEDAASFYDLSQYGTAMAWQCLEGACDCPSFEDDCGHACYITALAPVVEHDDAIVTRRSVIRSRGVPGVGARSLRQLF